MFYVIWVLIKYKYSKNGNYKFHFQIMNGVQYAAWKRFVYVGCNSDYYKFKYLKTILV